MKEQKLLWKNKSKSKKRDIPRMDTGILKLSCMQFGPKYQMSDIPYSLVNVDAYSKTW